MMAGKGTGVLQQPHSDQVRRLRSPVVVPAVMAAEGAAFAALLGLDGSPPGQAARILVALALTALAVWFTRRAGRTGRGATALLLGIAGTAGGAGVAGVHLAKAGVDAAALLAAVVLITGVSCSAGGPPRWSGRYRAGGGCWPSRRPGCCLSWCCSR